MPLAADRDSFKPRVAEVAFRAATSPRSAADVSIVPVAAHEYLRAIRLNYPKQGAWSAVVELFDQTGDFLENLIVGAGDRRGIMFRFGFDGPGGIEVLPLYVGTIAKYDIEFTPTGVTVTCDVVASGVIESAILQKTRSWPAGTRISDIAEEIARDRGWLIHTDGRPSIQRTSNFLPETVQIRSDIKFIQEQLCVYALDESGTAGFHANILRTAAGKDVFSFKNDSFQPSEAVARYVFARDAWGEVVSFKPTDGSALGVFLGAGDASYEALDSLEGVRISVGSSRLAGIDGERNVAFRDSGYRTDVGVPEGALSQRIVMPERDQALARARAQDQYLRATAFAFTATMTVQGNHLLQVGATIIAEYRRADGTVHFLSGAYRIDGVEHTYGADGFYSNLSLSRTGKGFDPRADKISATQIVIPRVTDKTYSPQAGASQNAAAPAGTIGSSSPAHTGGSTPRRGP